MSSEFLHHLAVGFCMMLVLEGIIPFLYPQRWRNLVQQLSLVDNRTLRFMGLASMLLGTVILYLIN